jgi:class 3 adenylate cyclase
VKLQVNDINTNGPSSSTKKSSENTEQEIRVGIGVSFKSNARLAARTAVKQAKQAVPEPKLALVFGSIHLNQEDIFAGLMEEGLDPSQIFGGSSYAEISPAGVTYKSLVVMLLSLPDATINSISVDLKDDPIETSQSILDSLENWQFDPNKINIGLLLSAISAGRENEMLAKLREQFHDLAIFGGMSCGNYDLGMSHPDFWTNYQYSNTAAQKQVKLTTLQLPKDRYRAAFGIGHGWETVGPTHEITKAEGATVFEIDGMPIIDFYRQFLGRDANDQFFELLIQRYGIALQLEERTGPKTTVKTPVKIDLEAGFMEFYPVENLHGRKISLIQANRKSLIAGARQAAELCLSGLDGRKPLLVFIVSCSQRGSILHSRSNAEIEAVREVLGQKVPILGWYSGGEIVPLLNKFDEVVDKNEHLGGSGFHGTTIGLLALTAVNTKAKIIVPKQVDRIAAGRDLEQLLKQSEETLDSTEAFLSNLSRQVYHDGERIRAQSEVLHRYTPHEVWSQAGASAERGEYEIPEAEFNGAFLFMDVKGFTSFSEKHAPQEVLEALNKLFEPATVIIYECGGDVDKYMGDNIFAAFTNQQKAVEAGFRIVTLFQKLRSEGNPFNVRLGINAGRAIRANVGGQDRREYTFIGDAVNIAQRLESNCTPGKMIISKNLRNYLDPSSCLIEERVITVKGKQEPITVLECSILT